MSEVSNETSAPPSGNSTMDNIDINRMAADLSAILANSKSNDDLGKSKESMFAFGEDENKERGNWSGKLDFLLSAIGFAVGLGNVWRFPYLCYRNGGGAFLIPYAVMLAIAGLPLFWFELSLGQFSSKGPIAIWAISPMFTGLGYAMITISGLVCIYYNMIIAYTLFYFFASFTGTLPWSHCNNDFNTGNCTVTMNISSLNISNTTDMEYFKPKPAAEEYWENYVLDISDGLHDMGNVRWQLALCLLLAWVVVFACLSKGIKSTGKVVYFTALFPYVVLFCLLCRGATLDGALDGIKFYIIPDWNKLQEPKVWGDAAVQIFYSLGPAWGGLITMASYNRYHNNCYRDALVVAITNCSTSVFAGFVIFSVIGYMAKEMGVEVSQVTDSGPGLAFVAYPAGLALMPGAPFWSILFFLMLFTLGLDSMFAMMETVITALSDQFPDTLRKHKVWFTLAMCIVGFLLGLPQCTRGGFYLLHLMDWYSAGFSLLIVSICEIVVVIHIYGYQKFADDIFCMLGFFPNIYWRITWTFVTPITLLLIIIFTAWQHVPCYLGDYVFPDWAQGLGWAMVVFALAWLPIFAVVEWWKHIGGASGLSRVLTCPWTTLTLRQLIHANEEWRPAMPEHQRERLDNNNKCIQIDTSTFNVDMPPMYSGNSGFDNPSLTVMDEKSNELTSM